MEWGSETSHFKTRQEEKCRTARHRILKSHHTGCRNSFPGWKSCLTWGSGGTGTVSTSKQHIFHNPSQKGPKRAECDRWGRRSIPKSPGMAIGVFCFSHVPGTRVPGYPGTGVCLPGYPRKGIPPCVKLHRIAQE
eukprot:1384942-Rhodomonas_salina.1